MDHPDSTQFIDRPGSPKLQQAGISIHHTFEPGDLGQLILIHGVQNLREYGFNAVHEADWAKIAAVLILSTPSDRTNVCKPKQKVTEVWSDFMFQHPQINQRLRWSYI